MDSLARLRSIPQSALRLVLLATATMLVLTVLPATEASAHGTSISPMSRHYSCWKRWGNDFQNPAMATQDPMCWQAWQADTNAMWNWNGLYREGVAGNHQAALPDNQLCSGGHTSGGRYNALDNPGAWTMTNLSNNFTFQTHDAARHGADYYKIYVTRQGYNALTDALDWGDLELVTTTRRYLPGEGTTSTEPGLNGVTVSFPVSAPGRTGRHIVFMIWQASHLDQSFYACADVNFTG